MDFIHGILKGYRIEYRAIKIGFEWKSNSPIQHVMVNPFYIKTTIKNLLPNTVYEIQVMAVNEHGIGAKSHIFYGGNIFLLISAVTIITKIIDRNVCPRVALQKNILSVVNVLPV